MIETHEVHSDAVGEAFRVSVAACGETPVLTLILTDADGLFGLAVDTIRMMHLTALVPSMRVVGIGYPGADGISDTIEARARDLTPTNARPFSTSGGADAFAVFVNSELVRWIDGRFGDATVDMTYFGHSLGGLFGTYMLLSPPPTVFRRYILSSPSLWWDDELMFGLERAGAGRQTRLEAEVVFGIGSLETDEGRRREGANLPDGHPMKPPPMHLDMVDDLRRFVDQLGGRDDPSLQLHSIEIANEFHTTVPGIVLNRALRHFFGPQADG